MEGLALAWARFPSVNVITGDLEIDCYECNARASIIELLSRVEEREKELRGGR